MGQGQSSQDDGEQGGAPLKQDYYDLLGVERTASDEEIKKAYRRRALELHPDRNYGKEEDATRLFAEIQSAYEILSDPQERAWYDSHRDVLLRGDGAGADGEEFSYNIRITTAEEVLSLMMKFSKRMEYSDSPSGFYGGLNDFFKKIAKEEDVACQWQDLDYPDYPEFGSKDDDYEEIVRPFYGAWTGFATKKSYSWKDKYRLSDAPDRRIRRLMEKENQKLRDDAIQEYNDAIRSLVAFVRKRDERVQNNQKSEAERQKALRDLAAAQAARARAQRQKELEQLDNADIPEWSRSRAKDEHEGWFSSESEVEEHQYECIVCDKIFKSEAQLQAHEKSKKHVKLLKELKRDMRKVGKDLDLQQDALPSDSEDKNREHPVDSTDPDQLSYNFDRKIDIASSEDSDTSPKEASQVAPTPTVTEPEDYDSQHSGDEYASRKTVEERLIEENQNGFAKPVHPRHLEDTPATSDTESGSARKVGKAKQKRAKKAAQQAAGAEPGQTESEFQCVVCRSEFTSKTKLFTHIKEAGHAAPVTQVKGMGNKGKRGKK